MALSRWMRTTMMAVILFAALPVAGALAQDATPAGSDARCAAPTGAETEALARAWTEQSLGAGNADALDEILSPDVVHHAPDFDVTFDAAGVKGFHQGLIDAFPGATYTIDLVVTEAPWAVTYYHAEGPHEGEFQGIAPTGNTVSWDGMNAFRVECGRVIESWSAVDELGRLAQLEGNTADVANDAQAAEAAALASPAACPAADRAEIEAAVTTMWTDGWNKNDAAAIASVVAEDVIHDRTVGGDGAGVEALIDRVAARHAAAPDFTTTIGPLVIDGEYAAHLWSATATDTGGLLGGEPTGRAVAWDGIAILRSPCGEITEIIAVADILGLRNQLNAE